ncbi:DNA damage-repair/toleration protein [Capsicum galapagoense]
MELKSIYIPLYINITSHSPHLHIEKVILLHFVIMALTGVTFLFTLMVAAAFVSFPANGCSPADQAALMDFKAALKEPYLGIFKTWTGSNCCQGWYGVSCDPTTQRVADIVLRGESEDPMYEKAGRSGYMSGSLSPSLCKLDRLTTLIVADWKDISGEIPDCVTTLQNLRILELIGNKITGQIPANIGQLSKLTVLNLADNQISGSIPGSVVNLGKLKHLELSNNHLSGSIPADIGNLGMMSRALLNKNKLTGSIPNSITQIRRLADLDLSMNQITGSLPVQLGSMPVLSTLNLDSNQISGSIPTNLLSSSGLNILNLSRNSLEGVLPDVFGSKTYFTHLDLSYNNLRGSIPKSLSSAKYIGHLDLSHNHLCGPIPNGSPFDHLEASSFSNNDCLCGSPLRTC